MVECTNGDSGLWFEPQKKHYVVSLNEDSLSAA